MNNQTLLKVAQYLDISPSDFKKAQDRFKSTKDWLEKGYYKSGYYPDVYLQGSFRLGTVVRPYREDKDGEFDIDQVCEFTKVSIPKNSGVLKNDIGDRLKENSDYERMLEEEGRRCWTIKYASEDGQPGFHIDILPAISSNGGVVHKIDITNKENNLYSWSTCNPKGYYYWFKSKNRFSTDFVRSKKSEIFESHRNLFSNVEEVPKQLIRTPLQRAIQIMKRHRDVYFSKRDNRPISIIITTICAKVNQSDNILNTLQDFVNYVINRHQSLVRHGYLNVDGILDYVDKKWHIPNPADTGVAEDKLDNFADKWNVNLMLPNAFFEWVYQLNRDLDGFRISGLSDDLNLKIKSFGAGEGYLNTVIKNIEERIGKTPSYFSSNELHLLDLIHLGLEGRIDWETVKNFGQSYYDNAQDENYKDIAIVNFYQIVMHRKISLSAEAINQIKDVLKRNSESDAFILCCNLLLGTASLEMIQNSLKSNPYDNILEWPIIKLFNKALWQ